MTRRRQEYFHITKLAKHYDKQTNKFTFNIAYETATTATPRTISVAEAFGLGIDQKQKFTIYDNTQIKIAPNDIVYITGDSGSGKSVLLKAIKQDLGKEATDLADITADQDKPLIDTIGKDLNNALELLSKAGLNDAFLFLRKFHELSDGQKYRYKIAKLMENSAQWWIADEFCSVLDRDTAKILAYNLQKIARQMDKAVVVATTHTDLFGDLGPSVHVHKRFGGQLSVNYYPNEPVGECSLTGEMRVEEGCYADYKALSVFHYHSGRCPPPRRIFVLKRGDEVCGVIVYSFPPPTMFGRGRVWKGGFGDLQRELSSISRVVVHPKYRTMGLGVKLVRESVCLVGTPFVEMVAVMAKYNPFAEKAGMQRVAEQLPSKQVLRIAEVLTQLGFSLQWLGSATYVECKLRGLSCEQLKCLKRAFIRNGHPRLWKEFGAGNRGAYGEKAFYMRGVENADLEKIGKLVRVLSVLLQSKVYLFKALSNC